MLLTSDVRLVIVLSYIYNFMVIRHSEVFAARVPMFDHTGLKNLKTLFQKMLTKSNNKSSAIFIAYLHK